MRNESVVESGKRISNYDLNIRKGDILTRKISPQAKRFFDFTERTALGLLVSDRKSHDPEKTEKIAKASLSLSYDINKKLKESNSRKKDFSFDEIILTIESKAEPFSSGFIFGEGSFHMRFYPNPPNSYNQYDMQLNFREIEINGKPKLAVIVESIHKGTGKEFHIREKMREHQKIMGVVKLRNDEVEGLKAINEANTQLGNIEKKLGCSMNELAFQAALAFTRGIGADIFMATDDAYVSTKQYYEEVGATKIYSSNNWVFKKNGLLPPQNGECFWINPYPNRLQTDEVSLSDSLFFYANTNVVPPDRYRNFPKGVSTLAIEKILVPFENNLRAVFKEK